jgi:P-type Cu+ transporter
MNCKHTSTNSAHSYYSSAKTAVYLKTDTIYSCPMHPDIVRNEPGDCLICGMSLEPRTVAIEEEENIELTDMARHFWISLALALPVFVSAMSAEFWSGTISGIVQPHIRQWIEMVLVTPAVCWGRRHVYC